MPSPVPFRKVRKLLQDAGWVLVRTQGSHHTFKHTDSREHLSIPVHKNQVKYCYVREIEKAVAEQEAKDQSGPDEAH
jgi:predicted RNA binding protein YcfA (HicA-like mRNA interferase family)